MLLKTYKNIKLLKENQQKHRNIIKKNKNYYSSKKL